MELEDIKSEQDITGPVAKALRQRAGLPQEEFWGRVGITQSGGCSYERARGVSKVARSTRILIYAVYVAGLEIDATSPEGVEKLHALARQQNNTAA